MHPSGERVREQIHRTIATVFVRKNENATRRLISLNTVVFFVWEVFYLLFIYVSSEGKI